MRRLVVNAHVAHVQGVGRFANNAGVVGLDVPPDSLGRVLLASHLGRFLGHVLPIPVQLPGHGDLVILVRRPLRYGSRCHVAFAQFLQINDLFLFLNNSLFVFFGATFFVILFVS